MFQIEQKLCKGTTNVLLWHIMVLNCRVCLYGRVWPFVAICGLVCPYVVLYGLMWPLWPYVASYGLDVAFHCHDYVWPH